MKVTLAGRIWSGKKDASYWLQRFHAPYYRKTGINIFPGSLNLELECGFDWYAKQYQPYIVWFGREEYGGERDILLLPCILPKLDAKQAFLWSTTTAAHDRPNKNLIEVITDVPLRASYGLVDGDAVVVELNL